LIFVETSVKNLLNNINKQKQQTKKQQKKKF